MGRRRGVLWRRARRGRRERRPIDRPSAAEKVGAYSVRLDLLSRRTRKQSGWRVRAYDSY